MLHYYRLKIVSTSKLEDLKNKGKVHYLNKNEDKVDLNIDRIKYVCIHLKKILRSYIYIMRMQATKKSLKGKIYVQHKEDTNSCII